jgi:chromosome segregation ATPase
MPRDLKDVIDKIEQSEDIASNYEQKIERLIELVNKQKKIISEQTELLETQKKKLSKMIDVPDDIQELREIIGTQRSQINENENNLEHTKGLLVQAQKELELTKKRMNPTQIKLDASLDTMGQLKTELAQKKSEILIRNETLKTFQNKIKELESFSQALQQRLETEQGGEFKNQINELKIKHSEERQQLRAEISKFESQLLDQKLEFQEKITEAKDMSERYEGLVKKLEELNEKNKEANEKIKSLNANMSDLRNFKKENITKITYLDKLKPLMEEDPLYRGFFIIQQVGSIALEDLKSAIGAPIVTVRKDIKRLQDLGLVEMNDVGKIAAKKFDNNI